MWTDRRGLVNGNETAAGSRSFTYDLENRIASTTSGRTTTTYAYSGDGRRLKATTGNSATSYLWDVDNALPQLALERSGSQTLRRYGYGADRISMTSGSADYYYHYDPLGSVAALTSSTGATQLTYKYEPFGAATETKVNSKAPTNLMRFTGEQLDTDTGLYHLRARQYDPGTGRFTKTDPLTPSLSDPDPSAYEYADDGPTAKTDASGESAIGEIEDPSRPSVFMGSPLGDLGYPSAADARRYRNWAVLNCIQTGEDCSSGPRENVWERAKRGFAEGMHSARDFVKCADVGMASVIEIPETEIRVGEGAPEALRAAAERYGGPGCANFLYGDDDPSISHN